MKPVQYLFMLMNIVTYKHEKSKITHKLGDSGGRLTHEISVCHSQKIRDIF